MQYLENGSLKFFIALAKVVGKCLILSTSIIVPMVSDGRPPNLRSTTWLGTVELQIKRNTNQKIRQIAYLLFHCHMHCKINYQLTILAFKQLRVCRNGKLILQVRSLFKMPPRGGSNQYQNVSIVLAFLVKLRY